MEGRSSSGDHTGVSNMDGNSSKDGLFHKASCLVCGVRNGVGRSLLNFGNSLFISTNEPPSSSDRRDGGSFSRRPLLAAISLDGKRRRGRKLTPEEKEEFTKLLQKMTPEQRESIKNRAWLQLLRSSKVDYEGRKVDLKTLATEIAEEQKVRDIGGDEPTLRHRPAAEIIAEMPSRELRPGAKKMMLRPEEEAALPLDILGQGNFFSRKPLGSSKVGGVKDCSFGVYARPELARAALKKWAGLEPEGVLEDEEFYRDILANSHLMELTLMVIPARNIPLAPSVAALTNRIQQTFDEEIKIKPSDQSTFESFVSVFSESRLAESGLLEGGKVKKGTVFTFTATPQGGILAEATTPGTLRDQKPVWLGSFRSRPLAYAVFEPCLGPRAVDLDAKTMIGRSALFVTNGFKLGGDPNNPNQVTIEDIEREDPYTMLYPKPDFEELIPADPTVFSLLRPEEARKTHLNNLRRAVRRQRRGGRPEPAVQ